MGLINSCTCEGVRLTHSKCDLCRAQEFNSLETLIDTEAVFQRRIGLIHRTWAVDSLVESWSELARRESNSSQNWPEFSSVDNPADDLRLRKVFPIAYRFPDIRKAWIIAGQVGYSYNVHSVSPTKTLEEQVGVCMGAKAHSIIDSGSPYCPCSHVQNTGVGNGDNSCGTMFCDMASLPPCPYSLWEGIGGPECASSKS